MDFASDAKQDKATARLMIRMTGTINKEYLAKVIDPDAMPEDKQVTCGTCHRGHHMPEPLCPRRRSTTSILGRRQAARPRSRRIRARESAGCR